MLVHFSHTSWFQLSWTQMCSCGFSWLTRRRAKVPAGVKFHLSQQRQTRIQEVWVSRGWVMNLVTEADWDFTPPHPEAAKEKKYPIKQNWLTVFLCSSALQYFVRPFCKMWILPEAAQELEVVPFIYVTYSVVRVYYLKLVNIHYYYTVQSSCVTMEPNQHKIKSRRFKIVFFLKETATYNNLSLFFVVPLA